jgi:hypothetical protein
LGPRAAFGAACLVGLVVAGGVLGACGGSTNSSADKTTTTDSTTTTSGRSSGGSDVSQFQALSSQVQAGAHATYSATYTSKNAAGTSQTITIEQKPPRSVFSTSSGSVINDGTHTYFCTTTGGTKECVSESGAGVNPLASITTLFSPTTLLNQFHAAEAAAGAHALGYSADFSSATYAGVHAQCVRYTSSSSQSVTYCVTNSGILAYAQSAGGTFELTAFNSAPPASDFTLPAGATVVTIPDVSIPSVP